MRHSPETTELSSGCYCCRSICQRHQTQSLEKVWARFEKKRGQNNREIRAGLVYYKPNNFLEMRLRHQTQFIRKRPSKVWEEMRLRKQRKECWIDILKAKYFFGNEILKNLKSPQIKGSNVCSKGFFGIVPQCHYPVSCYFAYHTVCGGHYTHLLCYGSSPCSSQGPQSHYNSTVMCYLKPWM